MDIVRWALWVWGAVWPESDYIISHMYAFLTPGMRSGEINYEVVNIMVYTRPRILMGKCTASVHRSPKYNLQT